MISGKFKRGSVPSGSFQAIKSSGKALAKSDDTIIEEVKKPVPVFIDTARYSPIRRRASVARYELLILY